MMPPLLQILQQNAISSLVDVGLLVFFSKVICRIRKADAAAKNSDLTPCTFSFGRNDLGPVALIKTHFHSYSRTLLSAPLLFQLLFSVRAFIHVPVNLSMTEFV